MKNQHNTTTHLVLLLFLTFLLPFKMLSQDCSYLSKANDIVPNGKCAPVGVEWVVTYRGVNNEGTSVQIQYDWDDGNPVEVIDASNPGADPKEWQASHTHTYPNTGDLCNYHPRATLVVNGVVCTSSVQEQIVTVWDTDDRNGGELAIDPQVYPICVGNGATFHFTDNSQWNCTPPDENDVINNEDRWIQWIYGTGGTTIVDAEVGGVVRAYPFAGSIDHVPGPIEGPIAPYNTTMDITIPDHHPVGAFFQVTLRNWNVCNPYDDPEIPGPPADLIDGDYLPVTTTAMALIVPLPDATITAVPDVCVSDDPFLLIAANGGGSWSGLGITDSGTGMFDPKLAGAGTHTITYNITDGNGCSDVGQVQITVLAGPTADILQGGSSSLCPGISLTLDGNPAGGVTPYTHLWKGDVVPLDDVSVVNPVFSTTTVGSYELIYRVEDDNGCFDEDTLDLTVEEVDISFVNATIEVCKGEMVTMSPSPSGGSGNYVYHHWAGVRVDKLSDVNIQDPEFNADEAGTFIYSYTVRDADGCEDSDDITVIVHDQPIANAGVDIDKCGLQTSLAAVPSVGNGLWKVVSGNGLLSFSSFNAADATVISDTYGSYNLRWIEDNNSCKDSADIVVSFTETPNPSVMADKDTCGLSMKLIAYPHVGVSQWVKASGPGSVVFDDVTNDTTNVVVDTPGVYEFTYSEDNGNGCVGDATVSIAFYQVPVAGFTPPPAIQCTPYELQFENLSTNADTYYWDFGNGNISVEENPAQVYSNNTPNPVLYDIKLIANTVDGCSDTLGASITIAPSPVSYFEMANSIGCTPLIADFTNKSQGATAYEWDFGDGTVKETTEHASHTFVNDEVYTQSFGVQLVVSNDYSCTDTSRLYTTVYPRQDFNLVAVPDSGCSPLNVSFIADAGAFKYEWDFGDGNLNQGIHQYTKTFTNDSDAKERHTVTLYSTSVYGCIDTTETKVVVLPSPSANFEPNDFAVCSPKDVTFINHTLNVENSYWSFGDGNSVVTDGSEGVMHTYLNGGLVPEDYKIRLVVENSFGCKDSMDGFTTVNPEVVAKISDGLTACSPYEAQFTNHSVGGLNYLWDFDDGNTSNNVQGQNVFENPGNESMDFEVSMIATSAYGCSDTAYTTMTILPSPDTYFEPNDFSVCSPKLVEFTNYTENIEASFWTFGDGEMDTVVGNQGVEHVYYNEKFTPLDYRIRLVTENSFGCRDSMDGYTSVNPNVEAVVSGGGEGCSPLEVSIGNNSIGASKFVWDYGDGNTSGDYLGLNVFTNNGTEDKVFEVSLIAESIYGCSDTAYTTVSVFATPDPDFIVTPEYMQMPESTVELSNVTQGEHWSYEWNFGDGETFGGKDPVSHRYLNSGIFDIVLRAYSGRCEGSVEKRIEIAPNVPSVSYGPPSQGCPSLTVEFYSEAIDAETYLWEFGDGSVSSKANPVHTYYTSGEYNVKLTVIGPGGQTIKDDLVIQVYPEPTAFFEAYPKVVTIPGQSVTFANKSVGADTYVWDFGDGTVSTTVSPEYEYLSEGNYDVSLEAQNEYGCKDEYVLNEPIIAVEGGDIDFPNAFTPNPSGENSGEYVFGDKNNYVFYPVVQEGIAEYKMQIYSRWGQLIFESDDINMGWNGYHKGSLCAQGVYIWKVTCRFGTGQVKVYTGDVTLIR